MDAQHRRVMDRALEIQARQRKAAEAQADAAAMRAAAGEVGVDAALLEQAEAELVAEEAAAEAARVAKAEADRAQAARRGRLAKRGAFALGGLAALATVVGGAVLLLYEPPPPAWEETFTEPGRWTLDVSDGTVAGSAFEEEAGRGTVGVIRVESFQPRADGTYFVNLDQVGNVDLTRYGTVSFDVRGEGLDTVRLYLEKGDERWRSPAVPVTGAWTTHSLPFTSFERQEKAPAWKVKGWEHPGMVDTLSFKVGHYMNGPEARGEVRVDDLKLE